MHVFLRILTLMPLLGVAACGNEPAPGRPPAPVISQVIKLQARQSVIKLTGEVVARVSSELSFQVSGRVIERFADVGDHVEAGAVLAKIDPTEQQADVDGARAALKSAEAQLRVATANFERQKALMASGFTTQVAFDQARESFSAAQGNLGSAEAQLGTATDALGRASLRSSASGIITARNIEVGQVAQSAQSAYTLAEDGGRDAVFDVYESIFLNKFENDGVRLSSIAKPGVTARGKVREVSPTVDQKTGTVRVKVSIENPPPEMTLGSAVTGEGRMVAVEQIVLPWDAMTASFNGPAVWVIDPRTRTVSLRDIVVDSYQTNTFVVKKGLSVGDRVVTDGGKLLHPGEVVTYKGDNE